MVGELLIKNTYKRFKGNDESEVIALNGVDLNIEAGEFVSLIGPSGCGKSTLLRLIAGFEHLDSGGIFLDGEEINKPHYERGLVFQNHTLFPWLSIYDNIAFGLRARRTYRKNKNDVSEYIKLVGLEGFEKAFPHQLSGGMCQRASLARALVGHPKLLLLDEPLGALDSFTRMSMQDELIRIRQEHSMTMVMVTHDVDEAIYLSDRVVIMTPRPGKIDQILNIELSRPRARNSPDFIFYRTKILEILNYGGKITESEYVI